MLHFVRHKLGITRKAGYDRFDENWLLIYNNWSLPALNIRKVSSNFFQGVKDSGALQEFDRIFIIKSKVFCDVSATGVTVLNVRDFKSANKRLKMDRQIRFAPLPPT